MKIGISKGRNTRRGVECKPSVSVKRLQRALASLNDRAARTGDLRELRQSIEKLAAKAPQHRKAWLQEGLRYARAYQELAGMMAHDAALDRIEAQHTRGLASVDRMRQLASGTSGAKRQRLLRDAIGQQRDLTRRTMDARMRLTKASMARRKALQAAFGDAPVSESVKRVQQAAQGVQYGHTSALDSLLAQHIGVGGRVHTRDARAQYLRDLTQDVGSLTSRQRDAVLRRFDRHIDALTKHGAQAGYGGELILTSDQSRQYEALRNRQTEDVAPKAGLKERADRRVSDIDWSKQNALDVYEGREPKRSESPQAAIKPFPKRSVSRLVKRAERPQVKAQNMSRDLALDVERLLDRKTLEARARHVGMVARHPFAGGEQPENADVTKAHTDGNLKRMRRVRLADLPSHIERRAPHLSATAWRKERADAQRLIVAAGQAARDAGHEHAVEILDGLEQRLTSITYAGSRGRDAGQKRGPSGRRQALREAGYEEMLAIARDRGDLELHDVIVVARTTGARPSEIQSGIVLKSEEGSDRVIVQIASSKKRNADAGALHSKDRRERSQDRGFTVRSADLAEVARRHDGFFVAESTRSALQRRFQRLRSKTKAENATLYTFRHQFKSDLENRGADREQIATAMGQRSVRTQAIYGVVNK